MEQTANTEELTPYVGGGEGGKLTEEEARSLLEEHERSGLTLAAFARGKGLTAGRLGWWRNRAGKRRKAPGRPAAATLVPVVVKPGKAAEDSRAAGFDVTLRSGHRIRVPASFDTSALGRLVGVLEEGQSC